MRFSWPCFFAVLCAVVSPVLSIAQESAPLAARFSVATFAGNGKPQPASDWFFYRDVGRVETVNPATSTGERWNRDREGRISREVFFNADRRILETSFGELKTRNAVPDWQSLSAVVHPRNLAGLSIVGKTTVLGRPATRYARKAERGVIELVWIDSLSLASRVVTRSGGARRVLTLTELREARGSGWPAAENDGAEDYLRIDVADLGDMEEDPFVARILKQGGAPSHGHAH